MKRPVKNIVTIIRDDREKKPWNSELLGSKFTFKVSRLKTGDYTIEGMESLVCVEKKENWEELVLNLSKATNRQNFVNQLRRMQTYPYRALVIHDTLCNIPRTRIFSEGFNVMSLYKWVMDIQFQYQIPLLAVGPRRYSAEPIRCLFDKFTLGNKKGTIEPLPVRKIK